MDITYHVVCIQMVQNLLPQIWQNVKLVNLGEGIWVFTVLFFFQFFENLHSKSREKVTIYDTAEEKTVEKFVCVRKYTHILLPSINF